MMKSASLLVGAASLALATAALAQPRPAGSGGTVDYWMSAETISGMAAGAMGPGGRPNIGALLSGRADDAAFARNLTLQLASPRRPSGAPSAEHLPPAALDVGPSLPLLTPEAAAARPTDQSWTGGAQQAQGRILIYWGCGDRARQGQPFEIDLARLNAGQAQAAFGGTTVRMMTPPAQSGRNTYGEWPNQRSTTRVPATGSLVGDHVVRGNYTPEIRFSLGQGQDFLAPLVLTSNTADATRAVPVAWWPVANARAYFLMATGAREDGTIVMWTSSEVQFNQMGMMDYLSQEEIARLIQQRVLLAPQTTRCTVPAEVAGSVQAASLMVTAFGPEANFSHPARPANAGRNWAPEWTAKLRTRSFHMGMLGMDMAEMMGRESREAEPQQRPAPRRRSLRDRLRDRILGND